jgi:nitroreductase
VEQALLERRSIRRYESGPLTLEELGQLLWAAQGITHRVPESPPGFPWEWRGGYRAESRGDLRAELARAAHGQTVVSSAPVSLLFAGVPARTAAKYGERAGRYVHMEVGAAGENVFLQCESLGLATVFVGAFDDQKAKQAIGLPAGEDVFAIMPVGRRSAE